MSEVEGFHIKLSADTSELKKGMEEAQGVVAGAFSSIKSGLADWGVNLDKMGEEGKKLFNRFGIDVDKFAGKFGISSELMVGMAAAGMAIYEVGKQVFEVGIKFDEAFADIGKITGDIGLDLREMSDSFVNVMGSGVEGDINDLASGFGLLKARLDITGPALEELTVQMDSFADVTKTSVTEAASTITDIMTRWNIPLEESGILLDQLTKAGQLSGKGTTQLTQALIQGTAQFKELGMSLTEASGLLAAFGKGGLDAQTVVGGLQFALRSFARDGIDAATGLEEVINKIKSAKDTSEVSALALETFGKNAGPKIVDAVRSGKVAIEDMTEALKNQNNTLAKTDEATTTFNDKWAQFGNKAMASLAPLGEMLVNVGKIVIDILSNILEAANNVLAPVLNLINELFRLVGDEIKALGQTIQAVLSGDWEKAWYGAQLVVLNVAKGVVEVFSQMVNFVIGLINNMILSFNNSLGTMTGKIDKIKEVSISSMIGLDETIKKLNDRMQENGKQTGKILGEQIDSHTEKLTAQQIAMKKAADQEIADMKAVADAIRAVNQSMANGQTDEETGLKRKIDLRNAEITKIQQTAEVAGTYTKQQIADIETLKKLNDDNQKQLDKLTQTKEIQASKEKQWHDQLLTQAEQDAALDEDYIKRAQEKAKADEKAARDSLQSWDGFWEEQKDQIKTNRQMLQGFIDGLKTGFADVFTSLGEALVTQQDFWNAMGKAGVRAIAAIVRAIGDQLVAMAAADTVKGIAMAVTGNPLAAGQFTAAGIEAAGAAAAYTTAGIISASFEHGTSYAPGGLSLVGEKGPELVRLPQGSQVYPAGQTQAMQNVGMGSYSVKEVHIHSPKASPIEMMTAFERAQRDMAFKGVPVV